MQYKNIEVRLTKGQNSRMQERPCPKGENGWVGALQYKNRIHKARQRRNVIVHFVVKVLFSKV